MECKHPQRIFLVLGGLVIIVFRSGIIGVGLNAQSIHLVVFRSVASFATSLATCCFGGLVPLPSFIRTIFLALMSWRRAATDIKDLEPLWTCSARVVVGTALKASLKDELVSLSSFEVWRLSTFSLAFALALERVDHHLGKVLHGGSNGSHRCRHSRSGFIFRLLLAESVKRPMGSLSLGVDGVSNGLLTRTLSLLLDISNN